MMALAPGAEKISGFGPPTFEVVVGDEVFNVGERIPGIIEEGFGLLGCERFGDDAFADVQSARDLSAIAGGCSKPRLSRIQHY